jgi:hypothetical protein
MKKKDIRLKTTNEIFSQIKYVKANAYEEIFYFKLNNNRE